MNKSKIVSLILKIFLTVVMVVCTIYGGFIGFLTLSVFGINVILSNGIWFVLPLICLPLIWYRKKKVMVSCFCIVLFYAFCLFANWCMVEYDKSITVNTSPNINISEYLPFDKNSRIVQIDSHFKLEGDLPKIDGAAAVFPVYSAFINAVYPETTKLYDGVFEYNNTIGGYKLLGEKEIDIFFGAYPSKEQIADAESKGTEFVYTPIGLEAFVFFVHKDNPINNLTTEQIQGIYSGKYTNWKELGGPNERIMAYQRNEGSGSQSMLKRFMGEVPLMTPPTEQVNDLMSGIIDKVSDYRSKSNSIGFSFRYYVEGIIQNPDIKMISIDGIAPTVENIKNGTYPITTSLYAVSTLNEENENVQILLDWVLSEEGQKIIEETGYVPIK